MPLNFAPGFRACCVAVASLLATAYAAESRQHPLVGVTREQLLERLGEPKSNIVAGNREVLLFSRERVVLRGNVVTEVELLPSEPVRRPVEPPPPAANPVGTSPAPAADPANPAPENAPPATTTRRATPPPPPAAEVPPGEAPLEIRAVRRAGATSPRPAPKAEAIPAPTTPATPAAPTPSTTTPSAAPPVAIVAEKSPASPELGKSGATPAVTAGEPDAEKKDEADVAPAPEVKKSAPKKAPRRVRSDEEILEPTSPFTLQTYLIAFFTIGGGIGYLWWRSRQRQLELAATTVSHTPFVAPASTVAGARFAADLVAKLEWKRFEELVAAYYSKTGVVAVRTKSGPSGAVHIKISWKGESRPFAFVQCISHPVGLVDAKPIQELAASLATEDIRRGYVVTTGKFNVSARDFAEEKHITLLPGDIFLEKLNALPDAARNELMQEIATGDYKTPSCPKCDAKMTPSSDDPPVWRCAAHSDVTVPGRPV